MTRLPRPALFAHRGAGLVAPENSLAAFQAALAAGADAIETDARLTRDGEVVLAHDDSGARIARVHRRIAECDLAEVQRWDVGGGAAVYRGQGRVPMPTLREALATFPDTFFNVDIKPGGERAATAVLAVIDAARAHERVLVTSFSAGVLRRVRAAYRGPTGVARQEAIAVVLFGRPSPPGATRLQIPPRFGPLRLDRSWVIERAHAVKLAVDYWVINDPTEAAALLALGADGIVTDDPARLVPVVTHARGAIRSTA